MFSILRTPSVHVLLYTAISEKVAIVIVNSRYWNRKELLTTVKMSDNAPAKVVI